MYTLHYIHWRDASGLFPFRGAWGWETSDVMRENGCKHKNATNKILLQLCYMIHPLTMESSSSSSLGFELTAFQLCLNHWATTSQIFYTKSQIKLIKFSKERLCCCFFYWILPFFDLWIHLHHTTVWNCITIIAIFCFFNDFFFLSFWSTTLNILDLNVQHFCL